jgi:hypothetical protein
VALREKEKYMTEDSFVVARNAFFEIGPATLGQITPEDEISAAKRASRKQEVPNPSGEEREGSGLAGS